MGNAKEWRWSIGQRHKQCYLWGWLLAALSKTLIISLQIKALGSVPTFFSSSGSFFPVCVLSRLGPFANSYNWDVHFPLRLIDHLLCLLSTGQLWAVSSWSQRRSKWIWGPCAVKVTCVFPQTLVLTPISIQTVVSQWQSKTERSLMGQKKTVLYSWYLPALSPRSIKHLGAFYVLTFTQGQADNTVGHIRHISLKLLLTSLLFSIKKCLIVL